MVGVWGLNKTNASDARSRRMILLVRARAGEDLRTAELNLNGREFTPINFIFYLICTVVEVIIDWKNLDKGQWEFIY